MDAVNREQAEHWNSEQAAGHWITHQARHDRMLEPFLTLILDQATISTGDHVLDIGCGCGATTRAAAALATAGEVVGIDLSAPMLARARADARSAGLANASLIEGDAQVHPFEQGGFDVVISRFGVMFFADPAAAFTNLRTAAKPGGRLVFVCWQPMTENQWLLVPGAALAEHIPLPDPGPLTRPACSPWPTPAGYAASWPAQGGATSASPRYTPRSCWPAAEPSTTPSSSCAPGRWAGPCSPAQAPIPRHARSRPCAQPSPPTQTAKGYISARPYGWSAPGCETSRESQ